MNCTVCGNQLYAGRTAFHCSCGVISHAKCWEKHILESHKPSFTIGAVSMAGEFIPRNEETEQGSQPTEKVPIAAENN